MSTNLPSLKANRVWIFILGRWGNQCKNHRCCLAQDEWLCSVYKCSLGVIKVVVNVTDTVCLKLISVVHDDMNLLYTYLSAISSPLQ